MRAGLIGCGHAAEKHLGALRRLPGVELAGVCDRNRGRAERLARRFGVQRAFDELQAMAGEVEVVHVTTPPATHFELARRALGLGLHVLVEKPLAVSGREARALLEIARGTGQRLAVCHTMLFDPAVLAAAEMLRRGVIGELLSAEIFWRVSGRRVQALDSEEWHLRLPGGMLHEVLPHPLYLLLALIPDAKLVSAVALGGPCREGRELHLSLSGGRTLAALTLSLDSQPYRAELRLYGTRGSVEADLVTKAVVVSREGRETRVGKLALALGRAGRQMAGSLAAALRLMSGRMVFGHEALIRSFYAGIEGQVGGPSFGAEDGVRVQELTDQVWEAVGAAALGDSGDVC